MKLLTLNFLTCARKTCKSEPAAFPLHPRDAELEQTEMELNPSFLVNMLPRLEWEALRTLTEELGLPALPAQPPAPEELLLPQLQQAQSEVLSTTPADVDASTAVPTPSQTLRDLHTLLMETCIASGKLVCGNCQHEYAVKEGIANFLLPSHMV